MGTTEIEKGELASYQLKDVAQAWCKIWHDNRALGGGPITWELLKTTFLESFFPREMREVIEEEFINLKQGLMTVREYSLKFVKLSRGGGRSTFGVRDQPRFKKGHQSAGNSNSQRNATPKEGRPEPKKGNGGDMKRPRKKCGKCGCFHSGERRVGTNACFDCRKSGHMVRDFPQNKGQAGAEPPNRNRYYTLKGREEQEKSADVVTCMLEVFSTSVYDLIDPGIIDDMFIYSKTKEDHEQHLRLTFKGVEVDPRNTEVVENWPRPLTPTDIHSFLGLASYYHSFVDGFSSIASLQTTLTKKKSKFEWEETCEKSFQELKDRLTSVPVLTLPKCGENYTVYCDTSRVGFACILMQGVVEALLVRSARGCVQRPKESPVHVRTEGVESMSAEMVGAIKGL
ncbi:uncharacterized protein [Solanum lycopersicum]|uniref:uncharacterized protein n=1 Tax=Solanum lycopersicum TaxID=4081 RepID=UPI00374855B9